MILLVVVGLVVLAVLVSKGYVKLPAALRRPVSGTTQAVLSRFSAEDLAIALAHATRRRADEAAAQILAAATVAEFTARFSAPFSEAGPAPASSGPPPAPPAGP